VREELCEEAIRLTELPKLQHPAGTIPGRCLACADAVKHAAAICRRAAMTEGEFLRFDWKNRSNAME